MIEMVLVVPLVVVLLGLMIFFGAAFARLQQTTVATRAEAWREARQLDQPATNDPQRLQRSFFEGAEVEIATSGNPFYASSPGDPLAAAPGLLLDSTAGVPDVHLLTRALYQAGPSRLPVGYQARITVSQAEMAQQAFGEMQGRDASGQPVPLRERFSQDISAQHTRHYHDWAYQNGWQVRVEERQNDGIQFADATRMRLIGSQGVRDLAGDVIVAREDGYIDIWTRRGSAATPGPAVAEVFLVEFDQDLAAILQGVGQPDGGVIRDIRQMYLGIPAYAGPTVYQPGRR